MLSSLSAEGHDPKLAIDRDLRLGTRIETVNGTAWLMLQFDEIHFIHKVVFYYRFYTNWVVLNEEAWCTEEISNFKRCVDQNSDIDVSVYQGDVKQKSCGTLQLTYALEQSDQIYTLGCNVKGDSVEFIKTTEAAIMAFEIVVTGRGNLARSKISASVHK